MDIKQIRRENLAEWYKDKPLPVNEKSYISQIITGKSGLGEKAARRLERDYGMPHGYLDGAHGRDIPEDFVAVQRVKFKLSAGISGFQIEYLDGTKSPLFFRQDWLAQRGYSHESLLAVQVSGPSMEPGLFDGDVVVINTGDTQPSDGSVFAVNYEGEAVIKRMKRDMGEWFLTSDNQDKVRHPDKRCHEQTFMLGRVIHKQSERI